MPSFSVRCKTSTSPCLRGRFSLSPFYTRARPERQAECTVSPPLLRTRLLLNCLETGGVDYFTEFDFGHFLIVVLDYDFFSLQTHFNALHTLRCFQRFLD